MTTTFTPSDAQQQQQQQQQEEEQEGFWGVMSYHSQAGQDEEREEREGEGKGRTCVGVGGVGGVDHE